MELKDIFRNERRRVFHELADLQARYLQLRERFAEFVRVFPPQAGAFPPEAEFDPDPEKPLLDVRFCGKELRFRFDIVERGARGQVRCLLPFPDPKKEPEELGRFTFNGEGIADIPRAKDADPFAINVSASAYLIVASFLAAAFR